MRNGRDSAGTWHSTLATLTEWISFVRLRLADGDNQCGVFDDIIREICNEHKFFKSLVSPVMCTCMPRIALIPVFLVDGMW